MTDQSKKLIEIGKELKELSVKSGRLGWAYYTTGYDFGIQESYDKITDYLKDKKRFETVCAIRDKATDPEEKRMADLLFDSFERFHLSDEVTRITKEIQVLTNKLSGILNTHRSHIDGKEVTSLEIQQILSESPDRELRKKAFLARAQVNRPMLEGGFIDLIKLRKEYAKAYGADDYVSMSLEKQDLNTEIFKGWEESVQQKLPEMNRVRDKYAQKYLNDNTVRPWDDDYIRGQLAPALNTQINMTNFYDYIRTFFAHFGYNLDDYNITYDLFSRRNKSEWGYNFPIETAKDSRILANIKDRFHEFRVLLHETGHALHSYLNDPEKVVLNMGISGIISEGIANLFGGFLTKPLFYSQFFSDNLKEVKEQFAALKEWQEAHILQPVAGILFDQRLYTASIEKAEDIHALKWSLDQNLNAVEPYGDEPVWAYRIHHTTHPIYLHNYFMGDVTCAMLEETFKKRSGVEQIEEKPEEFARFLYDEVISHSGLYPYPELFKRIAGEDFSLKYIL